MIIYSILAAKPYGSAEGELNKALWESANKILGAKHQVITKDINEGYSKKEEQNNFLKADIIIFQFPMYWFNVPFYFKEYFDSVYENGVFWKNTTTEVSEYGRGGLLVDKKYMLSCTYNGAAEIFEASFAFEGLSTDIMLTNIHVMQRYIGLKSLPTFSAFNVYDVYEVNGKKYPTVPPLEAYEKHLKKYLPV